MKLLYASEYPTNDEVLNFFGLQRTPSFEVTKKAFHRLQLLYHPDKHAGASSIDKETATRNSQTINRLYDMLPEVIRQEIRKERRNEKRNENRKKKEETKEKRKKEETNQNVNKEETNPNKNKKEPNEKQKKEETNINENKEETKKKKQKEETNTNENNEKTKEKTKRNTKPNMYNERKFTKLLRRTKNWPKKPRHQRPKTPKQYAHIKTKPQQSKPPTIVQISTTSSASKNDRETRAGTVTAHYSRCFSMRTTATLLPQTTTSGEVPKNHANFDDFSKDLQEFKSRQKNKRVFLLVKRFIKKLRNSLREKELIKRAEMRQSERTHRQAELKEFIRSEFRRRLYLVSNLGNIEMLKDWMVANVEHCEEICREWSKCFQLYAEKRYFLWCLASELITHNRRYKSCFRIHLLSRISFCDDAKQSRKIKDIIKYWMKWRLYDDEFFEYLNTFHQQH